MVNLSTKIVAQAEVKAVLRTATLLTHLLKVFNSLQLTAQIAVAISYQKEECECLFKI